MIFRPRTDCLAHHWSFARLSIKKRPLQDAACSSFALSTAPSCCQLTQLVCRTLCAQQAANQSFVDRWLRSSGRVKRLWASAETICLLRIKGLDVLARITHCGVGVLRPPVLGSVDSRASRGHKHGKHSARHSKLSITRVQGCSLETTYMRCSAKRPALHARHRARPTPTCGKLSKLTTNQITRFTTLDLFRSN